MEFRFCKKCKEADTEKHLHDDSETPCLSIFLPIVESEYEQEKLRTERLDNKAMALLTIIVALITIYVPIYPFDKIVLFYSKSRVCLTIPIIFSLFVLMGVVAVGIAIYSANKLIEVYRIKEFQAVNIEQFNSNEKLGYKQAARFQLELIDHYQSIILTNSEINSRKAEILNKQFRNVVVIFVLLTLSAVGTLVGIAFWFFYKGDLYDIIW